MRTAETPAPAAITEMTKAMVAIVDIGMAAPSPFTFFHLLSFSNTHLPCPFNSNNFSLGQLKRFYDGAGLKVFEQRRPKIDEIAEPR